MTRQAYVDAAHDELLLQQAALDAQLGIRPSREVFAHAIAVIEHSEVDGRLVEERGHTRRHRTLEEIERVPEWDRAKIARRPKRRPKGPT